MSTISTKITHTVTVGAGGVYSPLTITATGIVAPGYGGGNGIDSDVVNPTVTNAGFVYGGNGGNGYNFSVASGTGVSLTGGTLNNTGFITGGTGHGAGSFYGNYGIIFYPASVGGAGVTLTGGTQVTNSGRIAGGSGGYGGFYFYNGASGGDGVLQNGGTLADSGVIDGGAGGGGKNAGGAGGAGVSLTDGKLTNTGVIDGGSGGAGSGKAGGGAGGTGVSLTGGASTNTGAIDGGSGGAASGSYAHGGVGGTGVSLTGGASINTGVIDGGSGGAASGGYAEGGAGGTGVSLTGGTLTNSGGIAGGAGGSGFHGGTGGNGVVEDGGALINTDTATIAGGAGGSGEYIFYDGGGGAGAVLKAGTLTNAGTITGGAYPGINYQAGAGVSVSGGVLTNTVTGNIIGGAGAGVGVDVTAGSVINKGNIAGGYGGGYGVTLYGGTLTNTSSGTITGGFSSFGGAGVKIDGGTLTTAGTISRGPGNYNGDAVNFFSKASTLVIDAGAVFYGDIGGFNHVDTIDLTSVAFKGQSPVLDSTPTFNLDGLTFTGNEGDTFLFSSDGHGGTDVTLGSGPFCYRRGTRILAEHGEVAIESLRIGDRVMMSSGIAKPIRWIGTRSYLREAAWGNREVLPILIREGALADGLPRRDLWVSPEHAMFIDGMLIPASALMNGVSIVQEEWVDEVTYFHLEFDSHAVIYAEGALAESFVDDESRAMFDNATEYSRLYPHATREPVRFCAPRVEDGEELERVRRRVGMRAELLSAASEREPHWRVRVEPPLSVSGAAAA
jgi:hypothetical protein